MSLILLSERNVATGATTISPWSIVEMTERLATPVLTTGGRTREQQRFSNRGRGNLELWTACLHINPISYNPRDERAKGHERDTIKGICIICAQTL